MLLNNTQPKYLQYSVQSFGQDYTQRSLYNLTSKDLRRLASHSSQKRKRNDYDYDEEAEEEEEYEFGERRIGYHPGTGAAGAGTVVSSSGARQGQSQGQTRENALVKNVPLEKTQAIYAFSVSSPGIVRIERIIDRSDNDVRIPHENAETARILVVPCPSATFAGRADATLSEVSAFCAGDDATLSAGSSEKSQVEVFGYPPLRLSYHKLVGSTGKRESYAIDSIAPDGAILSSHSLSGESLSRRSPKAGMTQHQVVLSSSDLGGGPAVLPQAIKVPLNISLVEAGPHLYRLDKVADACGNSLDFSALRERYSSSSSDPLAASGSADGKAPGGFGSKLAHRGKPSLASTLERISSRKMLVYPRSRVSFVGCGTGASASASAGGPSVKLLQGKKTNLQLAIRGDSLPQRQPIEDGPWEVRVRYEPEQDNTAQNSDTAVAKQRIGWEKTFKLSKKNEVLEVDQPGQYSVTALSGAHCSGDVLEPSEVSNGALICYTC